MVMCECIGNPSGELKSGLTIWLRQTPTDETWRQLVLVSPPEHAIVIPIAPISMMVCPAAFP